MSEHSQPDAGGGEGTAITLKPLFPAGEPRTIAATIEDLGLWQRGGLTTARPRVLLNMVSSVDGRASLHGRSAPLSDAADRALFHGLRSSVDAVLVGARTVRVERYGRLIPQRERRQLRAGRGLAEEPLACVVSDSLDLGDAPLLQEREAHVAILTASQASLPAAAAQIDYVRERSGDGSLDLAAALRALAARFAVETLLCEGGPHLACQLLAAGLVDELFLSLSPTLAAGLESSTQGLRILAGAELDPPRELRLLGVMSAGSSLFLRYGVGA